MEQTERLTVECSGSRQHRELRCPRVRCLCYLRGLTDTAALLSCRSALLCSVLFCSDLLVPAGGMDVEDALLDLR